MVTAPLYTGESIFLGSSKTSARKAFPNARKVILKVPDPARSLEGESTQNIKISEFFDQSTTSDTETAIPPQDDASGHSPHVPIMSEVARSVPNPREGENFSDSMEVADTLREAPNDPESTSGAEILSDSPISLTEIVQSGDPTLDIHEQIKGHFSEDPFFRQILTNPKDFRNFEVSNDLVFLKDQERRILCIPDVKIGARRLREILISHAHSILAHLGQRKTITYLWDNV